jgi:phosphoglycerate dehydrogenase-like enzyme
MHSLIVISDPADPLLALLDELPPETSIAVGNRPEAFANAAPEAEAILNWLLSGTVLRQVFGLCPRVKWVHTRTAGLDKLLFPALIESPAQLTNGSGVFSPSLGEFALAAILYFAKDLRRMIRSQQAAQWAPFDVEMISGRTVGIVGYGDIGRAVASRVRAMGMEVLAVKRHAPPSGADDRSSSSAGLAPTDVYGPERLTEMLSRCDYVVVAAPLTPETRAMIGAREFAAMKPDAVIVNVGRGPVIDEAAMLQALTEKRIKGAALDVFDQEPLPADHPFYKLENVLLSPHCADNTVGWETNAMRFFLAQYNRFRIGEPLLNVVDKKLGY